MNNPLYAETNYIYSIYCAKDYLKDEDIVVNKRLQYTPWALLQQTQDRNEKICNVPLFKDALRILVYCSNWDDMTEIHKVSEWLEKCDGCDLYIEDFSTCMFGKHDETLFMPEHLRKQSVEQDRSDIQNREWNNCMTFYVYGNLADLVTSKILTREQVIKQIKQELEK